jgi:hypothetical protein
MRALAASRSPTESLYAFSRGLAFLIFASVSGNFCPCLLSRSSNASGSGSTCAGAVTGPTSNLNRLPYQFSDKEGVAFGAMADFYCPGLDLYIEIKCSHLNARTSKAKAELAYNRVEPAKRFGKNATYYQTRHQWNHAAPKQAIVQSTVGAPQFAIVFTQQPDDATLDRIAKQGIEAYSLSRFASMIRLQLACQKEAA